MKITRRRFISTTIAGATGIALNRSLLANKIIKYTAPDPFELVNLGKTGIKVSLISAGTGAHGGNRESNMTRLGKEKFEFLLNYALERGVRFFDCADTYGTHPYIANAFKSVPRDKYVLSSKIWLHEGGIPEQERPDADVVVNRFLKEFNTDYIDLILLHCLSSSDWPKKFEKQMEILTKLKEKGVIRAHGVSVHSLDAMKACLNNPWVNTVHARINAYGTAMDNKDPDIVAEVVKKLHDEGKGIIGMKLIGNGAFKNEPEKINNSIKYVMGLGAVDTLAVGFEQPGEIDNFAKRLEHALKI